MSAIRVNRRTTLLSAAGLGATLGLPQKSGAQRHKQPNIVWIVCHDIHAPLLGCYGNALAKTPAIDQMAQTGIRYENAFSTTPVCSPSRFSLITGVHPQSCGPAENMRAVAKIAGKIKTVPEYLRAAGYYCTNNVFTDYNCDIDPGTIWDDCSITAHWRGRPAGRPFFCVYNYLITHESHIFETTPTRTDPALVSLPPYLPDTPDIRDAAARNIDMVNAQDKAVAHILQELKQDGLADDTIVFFLADHGGVLPRTKRYCYEGGLHVPLIVSLPKRYQHLASGPVGKADSRLVSLIDLPPTTLSLAGIRPPPIMQGRSFLGAENTPERQYVFGGRNRMDTRLDLTRTLRDRRFRYIRNYMPHRPYGQYNNYAWQGRAYQSWEEEWRAARLNAVQSRFWEEKPAEELYDIEVDPHQIQNLANEPAYREKRNELAQALEEEMIALNDNAFIAEDMAAQGYDESRVPGAYPLATLLQLGRKVSERNIRDQSLFLNDLQHDHEIIRYWAATGLLAQRALLEKGVTPHIARAFSLERSPAVKAVLAETLLDLRHPETALPWLAGTITDQSDFRASLSALTAATYGDRSRGEALVRSVTTALISPVDARDISTVLALFNVRSAAVYLQAVLTGSYAPRMSLAHDTPDLTRGPGGKLLLKAMGGRIGDPQI